MYVGGLNSSVAEITTLGAVVWGRSFMIVNADARSIILGRVEWCWGWGSKEIEVKGNSFWSLAKFERQASGTTWAEMKDGTVNWTIQYCSVEFHARANLIGSSEIAYSFNLLVTSFTGGDDIVRFVKLYQHAAAYSQNLVIHSSRFLWRYFVVKLQPLS